MNKVFIIAEAGVNHNGDINLAYKLVDKAKESGANAVKFQTFKTEKIVSRKAETASYQKEKIKSQEAQFDMLKKLELSYEDFRKIKKYCDDIGITFLSTPDEEESLDFLVDDLKVPAIKIGSGEITNLPFLKLAAMKNVPIILSTGMANLSEIEEAINVIFQNQNSEDSSILPPLTLLHCTTNYPTPFEEVNLKAMLTLKEAFKLPVGYSDHTLGIEVSIAAVALGAKIIEKHFTLDKNLPGPDHKASLEPDELKMMIKAIRNTEISMGDGIKRPNKSEIEIMKVVRKTLVAARNIRKGEIIEETDITIKRAGTGIPPKFMDIIVGMKINKDIEKDTPFDWSFFKG
jgi:N-acetylneuraminate synthase